MSYGECVSCGMMHRGDCPTDDWKVRAERAEAALAKINAIRNSIVGIQGFNFSEHAYPLVAALNEAGFEGLPYPEARANVGTLIERAERAEARVKELEAALAEATRRAPVWDRLDALAEQMADLGDAIVAKRSTER